MAAVDEVGTVLRSLRGIWDEMRSMSWTTRCRRPPVPSTTAPTTSSCSRPPYTMSRTARCSAKSPPRGTTRVAQDWLTPRFGERVGWLAGAHVAANRDLVATDPDYASTLSDVSVDSLQHQGGAGVDPAFVEHPWWPDALRLRRYDDAAKDPKASGASIDDVLALAERILHQRNRRDRP
jgi:hypothetical protein